MPAIRTGMTSPIARRAPLRAWQATFTTARQNANAAFRTAYAAAPRGRAGGAARMAAIQARRTSMLAARQARQSAFNTAFPNRIIGSPMFSGATPIDIHGNPENYAYPRGVGGSPVQRKINAADPYRWVRDADTYRRL